MPTSTRPVVDFIPEQLRLPSISGFTVRADFTGGELSSDFGALVGDKQQLSAGLSGRGLLVLTGTTCSVQTVIEDAPSTNARFSVQQKKSGVCVVMSASARCKVMLAPVAPADIRTIIRNAGTVIP